MDDCQHDWRGDWECRLCRVVDRRGPNRMDRLEKRVAELEAALREIAGGEISGHGEIVVRSDSMRIAHEALEKK